MQLDILHFQETLGTGDYSHQLTLSRLEQPDAFSILNNPSVRVSL